ncbi:unnamed protein product, partial [Effrenium voratum]
VSDDLKQLKATTDSFLTFTRKLYTLLPEKSADKPLTKQLELLQCLPYKNLAYNGNKIDKNVIASAKSVIKRADPDAVSFLTRLTHVAAWFLAACHSMLRRKFATTHEMTDDSIIFIVSALAKSVCTPDFQKVLDSLAVSASITELARAQGPVLEFMLACVSREHDSDILKLTQEKGSSLNILSSDLSVAHSHALSQMQIQTVEEAPPMNLNLLVSGKKPDLLQQEMEQLSADQ